jgi:hypothetical protein
LPTTFERVKAALDILVPRAAKLVGGSADELIGKHCRALRLAYQGRLLLQGREPVDYSRPTTQLAYLYRTVPAHADWVCQALATAPHAVQKLLATGHVKVACVGGGPGSDMLGIVKYAEDFGYPKTSFEFVVLDREIGWNTPRGILAHLLGPKVSQIHQHLDLTEAGNWTPNWDFQDADIFTFIFSLSEVWCYNASGAVTEFLKRVVRHAKPGALFIYVDNGGNNFPQIIDQQVGGLPRLKLIGSRDNPQMRLRTSERRDTLEVPYKTRFQNEWVKMGGDVSIRVWQKT